MRAGRESDTSKTYVAPCVTRIAVLVRQIKIGPEQNFEYILIDEPTGEAMVIDSGWEVDPIVAAAREESLEVKFAVATHHHSDHTATLWQLAQLLNAMIVAHSSSPLTHDISVSNGEVLRVGKIRVKVLHTPGHTNDSICLFDGEHLFTGDTLLIGSCGRTGLEEGSPRKMHESLRLILELPPTTIVCPGHDYGEAKFRTLLEEKNRNPELSAASYNEFIRAHAERGRGNQ
jgi:glyoxylase-like metal-dependent hydrolase (beta-lactamase superfamily II)